MPAAHKKVLVRRFLGDTLPGYLPASDFVRSGALGLLDLTGRVSNIHLNDIKYVSYVRDFNLSDSVNPERLVRRAFLSRPRTEGLWIRLTFRSPIDLRVPDTLEGLAATDLSLLDDVLADSGLFLIPPDIRSNTQRLFIPRSSITDLQIIAVVTSPSRRKAATTPSTRGNLEDLQEDLFDTSLAPNTRPN